MVCSRCHVRLPHYCHTHSVHQEQGLALASVVPRRVQVLTRLGGHLKSRASRGAVGQAGEARLAGSAQGELGAGEVGADSRVRAAGGAAVALTVMNNSAASSSLSWRRRLNVGSTLRQGPHQVL